MSRQVVLIRNKRISAPAHALHRVIYMIARILRTAIYTAAGPKHECLGSLNHTAGFVIFARCFFFTKTI